MACLFGHKWNGCKCTKCGKVRDEQHNWDSCICKKCGKVRNEQHVWDAYNGKCIKCGETCNSHIWDGCKCKRCGKIRNEQHDWDGCKCKRCGRSCNHLWVRCKCERCGITEVSKHVDLSPFWDGCRCACGKTRDEQHDWDGCKCKRCGKTRNKQHDWEVRKAGNQGNWFREAFCGCKRCGIEHDFHNGVCVKCDKKQPTKEDAEANALRIESLRNQDEGFFNGSVISAYKK